MLGLALYLLIPCHLLVAYVIEAVAAEHARWSRQGMGAKKKDDDDYDGTRDKASRGDKGDTRGGTRGGTRSPTEDESRRFLLAWKLAAWAHGLNITVALALTTYVVFYHIHHPLIGTLTELHAVIVWLKTASYALTNRDLRHAYLHPARGELEALPEIYARCPYPQNITVANLVYFWWAPTLVYQPAYPRSDSVRWVFVAKRLAEVFGLSVFIWFCSAQYATPVLQNSLSTIASLDLLSIVERLLKLSTISIVI